MKKTSKQKKSSNAAVTKRVLQILEAMLEGGNTHEIIQHFSSEFKVSARQIHTYISKAKKLLEEKVDESVDAEFGKAIKRLNKLFNKSLQIMDFKTCLSIQKEINSMFGLNSPKQIDVTTQGESINQEPDLSSLSDDELLLYSELTKKIKK